MGYGSIDDGGCVLVLDFFVNNQCRVDIKSLVELASVVADQYHVNLEALGVLILGDEEPDMGGSIAFYWRFQEMVQVEEPQDEAKVEPEPWVVIESEAGIEAEVECEARIETEVEPGVQIDFGAEIEAGIEIEAEVEIEPGTGTEIEFEVEDKKDKDEDETGTAECWVVDEAGADTEAGTVNDTEAEAESAAVFVCVSVSHYEFAFGNVVVEEKAMAVEDLDVLCSLWDRHRSFYFVAAGKWSVLKEDSAVILHESTRISIVMMVSK